MDKVANIRASISPPLVQCEDNPACREVLLDSFSPLSEQDICEIVQQLKPSSCFNDVVPVRLCKEVVGTTMSYSTVYSEQFSYFWMCSGGAEDCYGPTSPEEAFISSCS